MTVKQLLLLLTFLSTGYGLWEATRQRRLTDLDESMHKNLHLIVDRINKCAPWRDPPYTVHSLRRMTGRHLQKHFEAVRMDLLTEALPEEYNKLEDCLHKVQAHIRKYHKALRRVKRLEHAATLQDVLSEREIEEMKRHYTKHNDMEEIEYKLRYLLKDLPESFIRKILIPQLHTELRNTKRKGRSLDRYSEYSFFASNEVGESMRNSQREVHPRPLNDEQLAWMGDRDKSVVQRLKDNGATRWDVMNKIGELFYDARAEVRQKSIKSLRQYCTSNLESLIGEDNFKILADMHEDSATVEKVETKFHEIVGQLPIEGDRMKAEHYGTFCRKIFRLVHFQPTDLTSWLSARQKFLLGEMIQDTSIGDDQVYQKVFDFYNATQGAQREEAQEIIESGCKWFIDHMFGDDIAENIEESRFASNMTKQQLAAQLTFHTYQIKSSVNRKHAMDSLPICTRIYIGYDLSCSCNGHSETCNSTTHRCQNCTDNTHGVQCEKCLEHYRLDVSTNKCVLEDSETETESEGEEVPCNCNGHSSTCDTDGKCAVCDHFTAGEQCEVCAPGYYGDALVGGIDDCSQCPCPNNGACEVNEAGLVQCLNCPRGTKGMTCEKMDTDSSESEESTDDRNR